MIESYQRYRAAGFACVPTGKNKAPAVPKGAKITGNWDQLTEYESAHGIGLICGNGLECLDFDNHFDDAKQRFEDFILNPDVSKIYEQNKFCVQQTVNNGFHVIYRTPAVNGSEKLASRLNGKGRPETLIETRGTGNYFCVAPTPGYKIIWNDLLDLPTIATEDRDILLEACRSYNEVVTPHVDTLPQIERQISETYNQDPTSLKEMKDALTGAGWVEVDPDKWKRPGKDRGISATLGVVAPGIFYNFSSNGDPFELKKGYTAFQVVGLLKYNGDFKAFARELHERYKPTEQTKKDLELARIDPLAEISEAPVYCSIGGTPTMTAGNFSMLDGKKKAGKTFLLGAITASMLNNSNQLEVIRGSIPPDKRTILYFDTEQSRFHATRSIKRICTLTGNPNPSNLFAYSLRPFTPQERLQFIEEKINLHSNSLAVVIIDGIRDLLTIGINDEAEATSLTSKFLKWTDDHMIHMILLLHQNKTDLNARGHIGTEMLNKAETVISVTKDKSGIFIVACEDSRDIPFTEFGFTIENGMITPSGIPKEEQTKAKTPQRIDDNKHIEVLDKIFREHTKLSYLELQDAILYGFDNTFGRNASRPFITHYMEKRWMNKTREGMKTFYTYNHAIF